MSEQYEVIYCLEQTIRGVISRVFANTGENWWSGGLVPTKIVENAQFVAQRDRGITPRSLNPIDYTTVGELSQIISADWDLFGTPSENRKGVEKVLAQLNLLRGPIAHCCPISEDEADRLSLAVRDWFRYGT